MDELTFRTLQVSFQDRICFVRLYRPEANNAINDVMIEELSSLYARLLDSAVTVMVLEGLKDYFCNGADFRFISAKASVNDELALSPELLFDLWFTIATAPIVTISHVEGKVNAGGMGFLGASDMVIANTSASFGLSEMLFGLIPACVMPFLIRRTGFHEAHYLALSTHSMCVEEVKKSGLINVIGPNSTELLRKHLIRLKALSKRSIAQYKDFMNDLCPITPFMRDTALKTNKAVFTNGAVIKGIEEFVTKGAFPWESRAYAE